MQGLMLVTFWTFVVVFAASWLVAMAYWLLTIFSDVPPSGELPDALGFSTNTPGAAPSIVYMRRFMRAIGVVVVSGASAGAIGIAAEILH